LLKAFPLTSANRSLLIKQRYTRSFNSKLFVELYHNLCDLIDIVNSTFTFPLIFITFYFMIVNLFSCYDHILIYVTEPRYFFNTIVTEGLSTMFTFSLQVISVYSAMRTSQKLRETPVIVSKIINSENCSEINRRNLETLLSQIQYRNLNFENSLFVIDWKLLLAVS
jgi:hypothetical protein